MENPSNSVIVENIPAARAPKSPHETHCFVVMPFGRDQEEERWFRGWYQTVIQPVVIQCGFEPVLSATEDQPGAINDEIRAHLVFDPMVIVDLGGRRAEDPPNPNVMYELGIRHAFGLPLVIMAWEGQKLPFDVSNQRAITTRRDFMDIEPTRHKLIKFVNAAREGRYYNPMDSVGREAAIDAASQALGEESLLAALAKEVRELRTTFTTRRGHADRGWSRNLRVKQQIDKTTRASLWEYSQTLGLNANTWSKFLTSPVDPELRSNMQGWSLEEWKGYIEGQVPKLLEEEKRRLELKLQNEEAKARAEEHILDSVKMILPAQPWPVGIHKEVADKLSISHTRASNLIATLIERGDFSDAGSNIDGIDPGPIDPEQSVDTKEG